MSVLFDLEADQGYPLNVFVAYPGDHRQATGRGQIKADYDDVEVLQSFRMDAPSYSEQSNRTTFKFYLSAGQTRDLPLQDCVFDMAIRTSQGEAKLLVRGSLSVNRTVTRL